MSYVRVEFHVFHPSPSPESGKGFLAAGFLLRRNRAIRLLPVRDFCSGAYRSGTEILRLSFSRLLFPAKANAPRRPHRRLATSRASATPTFGTCDGRAPLSTRSPRTRAAGCTRGEGLVPRHESAPGTELA